MAAADFDPILDRIEEVLCDGSIVVRRGIVKRDAFRWNPGRDAPEKIPASAASVPTVDVEVTALRNAEGTPGNESGDWHLYEADFLVSIVYARGGGDYLPGNKAGSRKGRSQRWTKDTIRVRNVLSYPGNLERTESGHETGLCSGLMDWRESEPDDLGATIVVRHRFRALVEIDPSAESSA